MIIKYSSSLVLRKNAALFFPIVSYSDETGTILDYSPKELKNSANLQLMGMTQNKRPNGNGQFNQYLFKMNALIFEFWIKYWHQLLRDCQHQQKSDDQTFTFLNLKQPFNRKTIV